MPVSRREHQRHMRPRAATERRPAAVHSLRNLQGRTRGPQGVHHGRRLPAARSRAAPGRPDSHPPEAHPALSLIPRRAGERRKTDRGDAVKIARDFRDDLDRRGEALASPPGSRYLNKAFPYQRSRACGGPRKRPAPLGRGGGAQPPQGANPQSSGVPRPGKALLRPSLPPILNLRPLPRVACCNMRSQHD